MLDIVLRLLIAGALTVGTAHLPMLTSAYAASQIVKLSNMSKPTRACPAQWVAVIRTCMA